MGFSTALGFAQAAQEGTVTLEAAIRAHLTSNMFPPVHPDFHQFAIDAVRLAESEEFDLVFELPTGKQVTVRDTLDQLHLWAFVQ